MDAISRFIGVYPVKDTRAQATITALEKWITSDGIPQKIIHDNGPAFINSDFINWTKEFGITLAPRATYSSWTNGKVEVKISTLHDIGETSLMSQETVGQN